jgi:hypothetical protein
MAVVPAIQPICCPEKCKPLPSQVPSVTHYAPQIRHSRNMIVLRRTFICKCIQDLSRHGIVLSASQAGRSGSHHCICPQMGSVIALRQVRSA